MSTELAMEHLTCIIDSATLVGNIHLIKQWVYNDNIRLHVPLCTFEKVDQMYKASVAPKEVQKELPSKKSLNKATRKDPPLFDINPRTTMEFLERARAGLGNPRVVLQVPQEQFTQWKEGEQQAVKAEQPEGPPTSFAQALLRKLNFNDGSDANGTKSPSKPRLVARSTSPKSPWKYHKVPTISAHGVSPSLKPLFSCILWRLHEFENNPLMPETFVLLSNDPEIKALAQKLNTPLMSTAELRSSITRIQSDGDNRDTTGKLEREFNRPASVENTAVNGNGTAEPQVSASSDGFGFGVAALLEQDEEIEELKKTISAEKVLNGVSEKPALDDVIGPKNSSSHEDLTAPDVADSTAPTKVEPVGGAINGLVTGDDGIPDEDTNRASEPKTLTQSVEMQEENDGISRDAVSETSLPAEVEEKIVSARLSEESDDDEEEVVVFQPRSRRTSGLPKPSGDASQPTTADGKGRNLQVDRPKSLTLPYTTTQLKPQSPIFIPRNIQSTGNHTQHVITESVHETPEPAFVESQVQPQPAVQPPRRTTNLHARRSEGLAQRQSRDIIERQREAIQRQAQVPAKPTPRQIQMEPTSTPTVIDPDAFDRSYVVQPPSVQSNGPNGNNGNHRPRGSPRRISRTPEPDVDYVLKSGSPRAATRGRGKLWVP